MKPVRRHGPGGSPGLEEVPGPGAGSDPFFCSWSGGKDSALALHHACAAGGRAEVLLTMMTRGGRRSRSHGLSAALLRAQAAALGVPLWTFATDWDTYEEAFGRALGKLVDAGVSAGVFGDIDFDRNRRWVEDACAPHGIRVLEPLWRRDRRGLLDEFLDLGFEARIVALRHGVLPPDALGEPLTRDLADELSRGGFDPAGEKGEYHTVVVDGPLFSRRLDVEAGRRVLRDGYWFQDFRVALP